MFLEGIPKEAYGLIGTLLGAIVGFSGTIATMLLAPRAQRKLEEGKLRAARQDALHKELLAKIQTFTVDLASAGHSMCWLTWATFHGALSKENILAYDKEMHIVLPKVSGGVVAIGTLDKTLAAQAREIADKLFKLDAEIGQACLEFDTDPKAARAKIIDLTQSAYDFETTFIYALGDAAREKSEGLLEAPLFARSRGNA